MVKSYRPESLTDLLKIIDQEKCHLFAGGTDLMIRKRMWQGAERKYTMPVVFFNHLEALRGIRYEKGKIELFTLTTQDDVVKSDLPEYLKTPYRQMATHAIRNVATVGGNIVNAASVADSLPVLFALDAQVELVSLHGKRRIPIQDFIVGKYQTLRQDNELLTKVIIDHKDYKDFFYKKTGLRRASILSKLSVYILRSSEDIRVSIGAVNDKPIRDVGLESAYLRDGDLDAFLNGIKSLMAASDDKRSTKDYRERVAINLVEDYLRRPNGL